MRKRDDLFPKSDVATFSGYNTRRLWRAGEATLTRRMFRADRSLLQVARDVVPAAVPRGRWTPRLTETNLLRRKTDDDDRGIPRYENDDDYDDGHWAVTRSRSVPRSGSSEIVVLLSYTS